jgi:hypothetical protein
MRYNSSSFFPSCLPPSFCGSSSFSYPVRVFFIPFIILRSFTRIVIHFLSCACPFHPLLSSSIFFADRHPFLILYVGVFPSSPPFFFVCFRRSSSFSYPVRVFFIPSFLLRSFSLTVIHFLSCTCIPFTPSFLSPPLFQP